MNARAAAFGLVALVHALASCSSGSGAPAPSFEYARSRVALRAMEAIEPLLPSAGSALPSGLSVEPALPSGLVLDPLDGSIRGTPLVESPWTSYVVSGERDGRTVRSALSLRVGPALPEGFESLEAGFAAETLAAGLDVPVRMALAPDGRLFFNELATGDVRVIDPALGWQPAPFASTSVASGGHKGLLGLALAPDFGTSGQLFVFAVLVDEEGAPRARVLRFTDSFGSGIDETVVIDDLPAAEIDNGGEILFDASGRLVLSVGDVQDPALAQDPHSLAGKILRYERDGTIPADNPDPASPVLCSGLRNTFALALHPLSGELFGADNGPDSDDVLNYLVPGRNFGWGYEGDGLGFEAGLAIHVWRDVIAPTAIAFHAGSGGFGAFANQLFLASYAEPGVRRIELAGGAFTDYRREHDFLRLASSVQAHRPLHLLVAPDGSLYLSTFTAIHRVFALDP